MALSANASTLNVTTGLSYHRREFVSCERDYTKNMMVNCILLLQLQLTVQKEKKKSYLEQLNSNLNVQPSPSCF